MDHCSDKGTPAAALHQKERAAAITFAAARSIGTRSGRFADPTGYNRPGRSVGRYLTTFTTAVDVSCRWRPRSSQAHTSDDSAALKYHRAADSADR